MIRYVLILMTLINWLHFTYRSVVLHAEILSSLASQVTFASALVGCILGNQVAVARDPRQSPRNTDVESIDR